MCRIAVLSLAWVGEAGAQIAVGQDVQQLQVESLKPQAVEQAKRFGLTPTEWLRYEEVMASSVGWEMQGKHPLAVLGRAARNDTERQKYARMLVRHEHEVAEGLLSFARARQQAWNELFPNLPLIADSGPSRVALFTALDCNNCASLMQKWRSRGVVVDIYVVGKHDDTALRRWAMEQGIRKQDVDERRITLNHDNGRWLSVAKGMSLPVVMAQVNGQWQEVSL